MKIPILISACLCLLTSCTTYLIPLESFKQQFAGFDSSKMKVVRVRGPWYGVTTYPANPIKVIKCVTKEGAPAELYNGPSIEMRVTYGHKHKHRIFYFDRVMVSHGMLVGNQSRFIESMVARIPVDSIVKIEVQDGQKKYSYIQ